MKILIVEDEDRIASFLVRGLEEEGYTVEVRRDGESGLERALAGAHDLMILDLLLPRLGGIELLRRYRERGGTAPVLVLTAQDGVANTVEGLESGADDYLTKPFAFAELLARVRAILRRQGAAGNVPGSTTLRFADIALDTNTRRVTRGARGIELSPREYALLECFLRHPDHVLSRTRLFEDVWGGRYDGVSNVVDVYVTYLRRKLEQGGEPRLIQAVRGHGYVLRAAE